MYAIVVILISFTVSLHKKLYENKYADKFDTYEAFEKFYTNLTDAMVQKMLDERFPTKKEEEVKANE